MYYKFNKNKGFTIVELMAILFIIALISFIVLANYRRGEKQYILNSQAQALAQFIREAQNRALGSAVEKGEIPSGGYGVAFLSNSEPPYLPILYADLNDNRKYDENDEFIKYFDLNSIIEISTICGATDTQECALSEFYINFSPPEPITKITGIVETSDILRDYGTISIGLRPKDKSLSERFIDVYNTGSINIR